MNRGVRKLLKSLHPEGIPWPGSAIYNAAAGSAVFQRHYELLAADISRYCSEGGLLDVGAGPGYLLVKLHRLCPSLRLAGLDASPSMVLRAAENVQRAGLTGSVEILEGFAQKLPFDAESFDAVVSTGTVHHWKDPISGLNEAHRVLKKGGHALMYDLVSDVPAGVREAVAREFGRLSMALLWVHMFTEPFYTMEDFERLGCSSLFREARVGFVGAFCCLVMRKE